MQIYLKKKTPQSLSAIRALHTLVRSDMIADIQPFVVAKVGGSGECDEGVAVGSASFFGTKIFGMELVGLFFVCVFGEDFAPCFFFVFLRKK